MFSQTVEYALRAVVALAAAPTIPKPAWTIAEEMRVPPMYLSKVMRCLVRAGIVLAQRGKTGGFMLARPADRMTVLDVVNAIDPIRRIGSCPLRLDRHRDQLCALHSKLDQAVASIETLLKSTFVSDIVEGISLETAVVKVQIAEGP